MKEGVAVGVGKREVERVMPETGAAEAGEEGDEGDEGGEEDEDEEEEAATATA